MKKVLFALGLIASAHTGAFEYLSTELDDNKFLVSYLHSKDSIDTKFTSSGGTTEQEYSTSVDGAGLAFRQSGMQLIAAFFDRSYDDGSESVQASVIGGAYIFNMGSSAPISLGIRRNMFADDSNEDSTSVSIAFGTAQVASPSELIIDLNFEDDGGRSFEFGAAKKYPLINQLFLLSSGSLSTNYVPDANSNGYTLDGNLGLDAEVGLGFDATKNIEVAAMFDLSLFAANYSNGSSTITQNSNSKGISVSLSGKF